MLTIGPVGSAAWVRVRPSIRVAGEADTCGRLSRLINRVAEPTGFLYARIGLSGRPARGAALYSVRAEGNRMSSALLERRPQNEVQPEFALDANIAARATALREGRPMPELSARFVLRDMTQEDIRNVTPLNDANEAELFQIVRTLPAKQHRTESGAVLKMYGWPANDVRWTLTPHEVAKLDRKRLAKQGG
jgi:hypothetical protein